MPKYGKFLYYKREMSVSQTQYVGTTLSIKYNVTGLLLREFDILYNILGTDARSLWEPKVAGQALWDPLDRSDPGAIPVVAALDYLQLENGDPLEMEDGGPLFIE